MTIPGDGFPKMPFGVDGITGRTTNLVFPKGHVKQGTYVIWNSLAEQLADDGTGVPAIGLTGYQENFHHK